MRTKVYEALKSEYYLSVDDVIRLLTPMYCFSMGHLRRMSQEKIRNAWEHDEQSRENIMLVYSYYMKKKDPLRLMIAIQFDFVAYAYEKGLYKKTYHIQTKMDLD